MGLRQSIWDRDSPYGTETVDMVLRHGRPFSSCEFHDNQCSEKTYYVDNETLAVIAARCIQFAIKFGTADALYQYVLRALNSVKIGTGWAVFLSRG
jgi:hypothetical protein